MSVFQYALNVCNVPAPAAFPDGSYCQHTRRHLHEEAEHESFAVATTKQRGDESDVEHMMRDGAEGVQEGRVVDGAEQQVHYVGRCEEEHDAPR